MEEHGLLFEKNILYYKKKRIKILVLYFKIYIILLLYIDNPDITNVMDHIVCIFP